MWVLLAGIVFLAGLAAAYETDDVTMKRRQQGILTGMPFMANLAPRTFVDDVGRKIFVAKAPSRIVSLAPNVTEILFALGLGQHVVGVTQFCDYPMEAAHKPKVGGLHPNLEAIVAQRPDLILTLPIRSDLLATFEQLKIPVFILEAKTVEQVLSHLHLLGRMLDHTKEADELVMAMRRRMAEVSERANGLPRPRLLYVLNSNPLMTVGPGSFIHQVIELAGATNIAADALTAYPRITMEEVLRDDPEILLFPVGKEEGIPDQEQRQWLRWTRLSAVRHSRFVRIPSVLLDRPGPRIVDGLEQLARAIHPDAFAKDHP
jgi:iron complex transport system substrate-binding protein